MKNDVRKECGTCEFWQKDLVNVLIRGNGINMIRPMELGACNFISSVNTVYVQHQIFTNETFPACSCYQKGD